ncbi:MAG: hypothetical protein IPM51_03475 [Sphingobacteriaceae bacterium]|nr:hypothetical protein [Sphingobacteriaceae bacterium]
MRIIIIISLFLVSPFISGQIANTYTFINLESNKIIHAKDSSKFMLFYQKLDSISNKTRSRVSIAHMGGSHVQGGTWSNTFITGLSNEFKPDGGGYFIFPYKLAKTNSPHYISTFGNGNWKKCRCVTKDFCLPLGMSGMSVSSNDSANSFGLKLKPQSIIRNFQTVKVYHNFNPSFNFELDTSIYSLGLRLDYPEQGYTQFSFMNAIDSVSFNMIRLDTITKDFILFGMSVESGYGSKLFYACLGANGAQSGSFLKCTYLVEQLKTVAPDLVIMSLGVNDSQDKNFNKANYISHYDSLIDKVRQASPNCAILLTTTTDNFIRRKTPNKRSQLTREAMFELMEKHDLAIWDMYELMGGYKSMLKWVKSGLAARDRVHFSSKGYTLLGNLMHEAMITQYKSYFKKELK